MALPQGASPHPLPGPGPRPHSSTPASPHLPHRGPPPAQAPHSTAKGAHCPFALRHRKASSSSPFVPRAESKTWRSGRSRVQQSWEPRGGAVRWDLSFPQPPPLPEERDELYSLYTNLFARNTWGLEAREGPWWEKGQSKAKKQLRDGRREE